MEPIIKLENIDFYYDKGEPAEVHALNNVSLEINEGENVSFFGPSGCGKSTILYVVSGIEKPTSGKVIINGQNLMELSDEELAVYRQIGIGIVFQNFNLIPSINNIENVTLPMSFLDLSPSKRRERAMEIFERLGIVNLAERYPFELSGGQQQRVGIARALANDPPIIMADEPLGNLDSANANNVLDLLKEFNIKDKKTIIMVTHEAWSLRDSNRIFYMRDGAVTKVENKKEAEFKKIGTAYYYKKLFPELPSIEARTKAAAALILRGHSQLEIKRLEYFLLQRFKDQIDSDTLKRVLDRPYKAGGVGLWKQKAAKIANQIEGVIKEEKEIAVLYKELEKNPNNPFIHEVEHLQKWLFEDFSGTLSVFQMERLNEAIAERLKHIITPDNFRKVLNLPKDRGGIGLKIPLVLKISERMESLLGSENLSFVNI